MAIVAGSATAFVLPSDIEAFTGRGRTAICFLLGWNVFVVVYVVMTQRLFANGDEAEFRRSMQLRSDQENSFWRKVSPYGDGPNFAVESCLVAFFVVLVVPHLPNLRINPWVLVPLTITIMLSCWALSVVSYALHYAEKDIAKPGLQFPGKRTDAYADYLYFSMAVSTTFGATDVNITEPSMRRTVNLHTMLTFLYNSVIVAMLASLLIN